MSRGIEFPPLRNGVDYLQDAVRRLGATPSPTDLKYAVLHLHAGVEVLLKYRLICEDWRLILEDADYDAPEVTEQDYEAGRGSAASASASHSSGCRSLMASRSPRVRSVQPRRWSGSATSCSTTAWSAPPRRWKLRPPKHSGSFLTSSTTTSLLASISATMTSGSSPTPCPTSAAPWARSPRWSTSGCSACVPSCSESPLPGAQTAAWKR